MQFDEIIDFRGQHSNKWDGMAEACGVSPDGGLAMWVADMDFRPPEAVIAAVRETAERGLFTYFGDPRAYLDSIIWWMQTRHGWTVEPEAILTTQGLVNAVGLCLDTYTAPGDGVVVFSPVYHAFGRIIQASERTLVECPLALENGYFVPDFDAWDAQMTGREKIAILCSPHNPGGRVWTAAELAGYAAFAKRHGLILISDEIHHDLVFPGQHHTVMALAGAGIMDRLIMLSATSKTFNVAGMHCGNAIIPDAALRAPLKRRLEQLGLSPNSMSMRMTPALYSPEGAAWVDAVNVYLAGNAARFAEGIGTIPGLGMMPMEGTYLAWVDFSGTGMTHDEYTGRVARDARIAANDGPAFGAGSAGHMRFNLALPRARIDDAIDRLRRAFSDLQ